MKKKLNSYHTRQICCNLSTLYFDVQRTHLCCLYIGELCSLKYVFIK